MPTSDSGSPTPDSGSPTPDSGSRTPDSDARPAREVQEGEPAPGLSTISEAIEDIAAGKMVILVDDEDRENEGDLVIAADKCTPEAINFMAKYGRAPSSSSTGAAAPPPAWTKSSSSGSISP